MNLENDIFYEIKKLIQKNKVLIFIKGSRNEPKCSFSAKALKIFNQFEIEFNTINILEKSNIGKSIKIYSNWPTIPQIYINGEFIGGIDILEELNRTSQLKEILERELNN